MDIYPLDLETIPFYTNPAILHIIGKSASANLAARAALRLSSWFIACTSTLQQNGFGSTTAIDHWQGWDWGMWNIWKINLTIQHMYMYIMWIYLHIYIFLVRSTLQKPGVIQPLEGGMRGMIRSISSTRISTYLIIFMCIYKYISVSKI